MREHHLTGFNRTAQNIVEQHSRTKQIRGKSYKNRSTLQSIEHLRNNEREKQKDTAWA